MAKIRVGVLRGGPSTEYDVSLKTGGSVLKYLSRDKYQARDILLSRDGVWNIDGLPTHVHRLHHTVDVIFNALHGTFGEDGGVQRLLDEVHVPYTGSGAYASALAMNKALAKEHFSSAGLKVPRHIIVKDGDAEDRAAEKIFRTMAPPWVVKPLDNGSSVGVRVVRTILDLSIALRDSFAISPTALVEEYIRGKEATCGVVEGYRGQEVYALFPVEIVPPTDKSFFDYEAKYSGISRELCPGRFSEKEKEVLQNMAVAAHKTLGLSHYSRSDFMIHPTRGIFILETNNLPGLTEESLLPKSLAAVGAPYEHFLDHVVTLALTQK